MSIAGSISEFADGEELGEELPLPFVWSEGRIDFNYPVGVLQCTSPEVACQVIFISRLEGMVLAAVPINAWHRLRAQRALPVNGLAKATQADVAVSPSSDRMAVSEQNLRVWLGFLREDLVASVVFPGEEEDLEDNVLLFNGDGSDDSLPSAEALVDVAKDHFAFFTVAEEPVAEHPEPLAPDGSGSQELSSRVIRLEEAMSQVTAGIQTLLAKMPDPPPVQAASTQPAPRQPALKAVKAPVQPTDAPRQRGSCEVGAAERHRVQGFGRDAAIDGLCRQGQEAAQGAAQLGASQQHSFVGVGGRAGTARRCWVGRAFFFRSDDARSGQVDSHCRVPRSRKKQAEEAGSGLCARWGAWVWRTCGIWRRQKIEHSKESPDESSGQLPGGNLPADRRAHGGGPAVSDEDARATAAKPFSQSLGRAQVLHRPVQNPSSCELGSEWNHRLPRSGQSCGSEGESISPLAAVRSGCGRQGIVAAGVSPEFGGSPSLCSSGHSSSAGCDHGRAAVFEVARSKMERSGHGPIERHRGLPRKEAQAAEGRQEGRAWQCGRLTVPQAEGPTAASSQGGKHCNPRCMTRPGGRGDATDPALQPNATVPGSRTSLVKVSAVANSLPRWLLQTHCGLRSFLLSILHYPVRSDRALPPGQSRSTWPMPVPFPEAFRAGAKQSDRAQLWKKRLTSLQVVLLNWFCLGCPDVAPHFIRLGARLTARQWTAVEVMRHLAWDGNTPETIDAESMGRGASKIESFEDAIAALHRALAHTDSEQSRYFGLNVTKPESVFDSSSLACGTIVGSVAKVNISPAKDIQAERVELPPPPGFNPVPLLDSDTRAVYERPIQTGRILGLDDHPPVVHIRATAENKLELLRKLRMTGRLQPLHKGSVRKAHLSGLFAVPKSLTRDRLILDARPANIADAALNYWCKTMASASVLPDIVLQDHECLAASGEDLRDFFYQFQVGEERTRRNALADPLSLAEARYVFGDDAIPSDWEAPIFCGLSTLAMGDQNACEFAQCSHLAMMLEAEVLTVSEMLSMQGDIPRGLLGVGIIIDDLVLLEKLLRSSLSPEGTVVSRTMADERLDRALNAYSKHKLEVNLKKEFRNQFTARFWGIELDGKKGLLRGSSLRMWPLIVITSRVAMLGLCTVSLLEALAGSWVSLFSVRRRLLCAMNHIFEVLAVPQQNAVLRLSQDMISELWSLALLGPLAVSNLRAQFAPFVTATDASNDWLAAVRAPMPLPIVSEVGRRGLRKGRWTKLLPPSKAWQRAGGRLDPADELPDDCFDARPLWVLLARCLTFSERWRKRVQKPTHINVLELRAHLLEERRLAQEYTHRRFLYGIDSQVCLGSVVKGRAASRALNRELIKALPYVIGSDLVGSYMYFPSKVNRADGPTRDSTPPPPDVPLPAWWAAAASGDFQALDAWILANEADVDVKDFDCDKLQPSVAPDMRAASSLFSRLRHKPFFCQQQQFSSSASSSLSQAAVEILTSFPMKQFFLGGGFSSFDQPGVLDLYSGSFGVAKALIRNGAPWVLSFEWNRSSAENLLDAGVRKRILELIRLGAVKTWGAAPICSSFSVAVTPPVRSKRHPRGLPGLSPMMRSKVRDGNSHCDFIADLVDCTEETLNDVTYWFENPDTS